MAVHVHSSAVTAYHWKLYWVQRKQMRLRMHCRLCRKYRRTFIKDVRSRGSRWTLLSYKVWLWAFYCIKCTMIEITFLLEIYITSKVLCNFHTRPKNQKWWHFYLQPYHMNIGRLLNKSYFDEYRTAFIVGEFLWFRTNCETFFKLLFCA